MATNYLQLLPPGGRIYFPITWIWTWPCGFGQWDISKCKKRLENIRLANIRTIRRKMGNAHRLGPTFLPLGTLPASEQDWAWEAHGERPQLSWAFPASPHFPATLADAPDIRVSLANITWKRQEPAQLSPAQTAYTQNCEQMTVLLRL